MKTTIIILCLLLTGCIEEEPKGTIVADRYIVTDDGRQILRAGK